MGNRGIGRRADFQSKLLESQKIGTFFFSLVLLKTNNFDCFELNFAESVSLATLDRLVYCVFGSHFAAN